jgi:hypothetical protein
MTGAPDPISHLHPEGYLLSLKGHMAISAWKGKRGQGKRGKRGFILEISS